MRHPHLFISEVENGVSRSLTDLRKAIQSGVSRQIWEKILGNCNSELGSDPLLGTTPLPGRHDYMVKNNDPDFIICDAAGQRMLRNALAVLVTEETRYRDTALEQIWAVVDEARWPDWISYNHKHFGYPADLRTGMLSQAIGIAYDWMHPFLDTEQKERILEGVDRRGFQPYFKSLDMDPWWIHDLHNWFTVIVGGLGISGMGIGEDHPRAIELVEKATPGMHAFLKMYGREGEFNESVGYSNATRIPVTYFYALMCHEGSGERNYLAEHPFPQTVEWTMHCTLPPGRLALMGDGHLNNPPEAAFIAAIASATRNPIFQGFALKHLEPGHNPLDLLWIDPHLETASPEGKIPLGKAYQDNSANVSSRTSWDYDSTPMVVYGKAKRDHNHDHNDLGQLCIDSYGETLVVDHGYPKASLPDFFEEARWQYYNASVVGHNVLQFGGREQKVLGLHRGIRKGFDYSQLNGVFTQTEFDDSRGGAWQIDLTAAYEGVESVRRTVLHVLPGFVACLDEARIQKSDTIQLRWNTATDPLLEEGGAFRVRGEKAALVGQFHPLDGEGIERSLEHHAYREPYHLDANGDPIPQQHEPYLLLSKLGNYCRWLTLFAVGKTSEILPKWTVEKNSCTIQTSLGFCRFAWDDGFLRGLSRDSERGFEVPLKGGI